MFQTPISIPSLRFYKENFMKILNLRNLACLAAFVLLFACGDSNSNPLIGKWEAQMGDQKATFTFTASELSFAAGDVQETGKVEYQKISDKVWAVTTTDAGGNVEKKEFEFKDNDNCFPVDTPEATLTRVK
jgi:major membrane immunogen (membrane-anchored lipoprotein)